MISHLFVQRPALPAAMVYDEFRGMMAEATSSASCSYSRYVSIPGPKVRRRRAGKRLGNCGDRLEFGYNSVETPQFPNRLVWENYDVCFSAVSFCNNPTATVQDTANTLDAHLNAAKTAAGLTGARLGSDHRSSFRQSPTMPSVHAERDTYSSSERIR